MIPRQAVVPLIRHVVSPHHEGPAQPQHPLRHLPEFHTLGNRRDPHHVSEVPHPLSEAELRRGQLHGLGDLRVLLVEPPETGAFVGLEGVPVHEGGVPRDLRDGVQEDAQLGRVADGDEEGARDSGLLQAGPERAPFLGVAPAVGSPEVPQEDQHGGTGPEEVAQP
eukprot:CAMPEP_0113309948 /NCGR_PEP_ID=MMETSP0010_2-20120614/7783_1 /TAXON_ID=216773 ORGANISM="Corethron hystrix, Strain 308" /NCGR_SAMPLE_ID=MMETSP0010_2 /ASSEMBLY_ACC=CAM_ASM_000155 /LENGTH=165 /DNA_ID=CAMNT_0000165293 /DNA_START=382 /DNA_END=876 /DNA_ORIENTATION=+ /assembly_acc=CAM_ASM_000155